MNDQSIGKQRDDPHHSLSLATELLASLMRAIHGGEWREQIDHDDHFVMVRR